MGEPRYRPCDECVAADQYEAQQALEARIRSGEPVTRAELEERIKALKVELEEGFAESLRRANVAYARGK